jgi:hypothetical protein
MGYVNMGKVYAGLTDDLEAARRRHGNPLDWQYRQFHEPGHAERWAEVMRVMECLEPKKTKAWLFGYLYTITPETKE